LLSSTSTPSLRPIAKTTPSDATCNIIYCDFSTLRVGKSLGDSQQANVLQNDCHMSVKATNTVQNNAVNVFDTSDILSDKPRDDPDLGSPNRACPGGGPGVGRGGKPTTLHPNCEAQGKVLILQDENIAMAIPRDSNGGGCLAFTFGKTFVELVNFAILDVDLETVVNITVTDSHSDELPIFESPNDTGDNGLWIANRTMSLDHFDNVKKIAFCFPRSAAISFIHFKECE
jgi:hypothetical protein